MCYVYFPKKASTRYSYVAFPSRPPRQAQNCANQDEVSADKLELVVNMPECQAYYGLRSTRYKTKQRLAPMRLAWHEESQNCAVSMLKARCTRCLGE